MLLPRIPSNSEEVRTSRRISSKLVNPIVLSFEKLSQSELQLIREANPERQIKRSESFQLPSVQERVRQHRMHRHQTQHQCVRKMNTYKRKRFQPISCSQSLRRETVRLMNLISGNSRLCSWKKRIESKKIQISDDNTIETVGLGFLVVHLDQIPQ